MSTIKTLWAEKVDDLEISYYERRLTRNEFMKAMLALIPDYDLVSDTADAIEQQRDDDNDGTNEG